LHNSLLHSLLKHREFLNIDISQGSVATCSGCGGVVKYDLVTNFLLNLTHIHARAFNGLLSGTTQVRRYQKCKTILDFTEARDSEWQWH